VSGHELEGPRNAAVAYEGLGDLRGDDGEGQVVEASSIDTSEQRVDEPLDELSPEPALEN
jgi:hypothetical protein